MDKLKALVKSRKFWAAVVGLGVVVVKGFDPEFPLEEEQISNLLYVLIAYIVGTAVEDGLRGKVPAGTAGTGEGEAE